ncbi:MAG: PQQ-dependent dehydrogenase, methanol/ethanol family [Gammaproteobacteria bacterium]|nr:PQQ-dependent dehydrogenase, methanol/ethanol family [Gammaproteobacteria bacterium]MCY4278593.1 PQQ-dependent dehydrogenase, methanol/ethanol family [Gammaproteobacteria bacterium]
MLQRNVWKGLWTFALFVALIGCAADSERSDEDAGSVTASETSAGMDRSEEIRAKTASLDAARIIAADGEPGNWLAHGRTYGEQRFSPLDAIDTENVADLELAWYADTDTTRGLEASPIIVDGVMFATGSWSLVYAYDAKTGEELWRYDPEVPREWGVNACCDVVNRGVAVWKGRVYVGTIDGRLVALDAGSGEVVWDVQTTPQDRPYTITGAPRVVKDLVIIGNGGAEYGVRGYITAYHAESGEQAWRFYTVPGNPELGFENPAMRKAAATWRGGEWWEVGGGGTVWDSMAYDPELDLLYIGTGNGSPWNRYIRSPGGGDNLYLSSILAINPDNGSLVWHYQTTPGDTWDYTATQHIMLLDLEINGQLREVLVQAPKNGFFYVIDRRTGEFISAEPYVQTTWASHVDPETGRPVETDGQYANEPKLVYPSPYGGHNWHPMAFNPNTGLVYVPVLDIPMVFGQPGQFAYDVRTWNTGINQTLMAPPDSLTGELEALGLVKGHLLAWDPVAQKRVWQVQHSGAWNGGLLSTAGGLVFQGRADGYISAFAADTGRELWESQTYAGIIAPPVSYEVDGEQYIAVMAGWGGAFALASGVPPQSGMIARHGRMLAYKLGGGQVLPAPSVATIDIPEPQRLEADAAQIERGKILFHAHCLACHGAGAVGSGVLPDLRYSNDAIHEVWDSIVLDGAFAVKGMVGFDGVITEDESEDIRQYVIKRAHDGVAIQALLGEA